MQWDLRETTLVAKDGKERERKKRIKEGRSIQRVSQQVFVFFFFSYFLRTGMFLFALFCYKNAKWQASCDEWA